MAENIIELKSISELLKMKFFIPNYQRGYRWTDQQVKDLLNDIWEFSKKKNKEYEFYCVQPLVVRQMLEKDIKANSLSENDIWYEVIDGQQRLTTIFIILSVLKDALDILGLPTQLYTLRYERSTDDMNISAFLQNVNELESVDDSYIDFYHISNAYFTIKDWLKKNSVNKDVFCNVLLKSEMDSQNPARDKANNIRFIWYESVNEDPIKVFTRLNIGKISLTNAELIKALFLNRNNFAENDENVKLRQQEIASEWDNIEYMLQNNEFWLFLHEKGYERPTRIDFIFDLICDNNSLKLPDNQLDAIGADDYRTFRYFYEYFKSSSSDIDKCWKEVKNYFQTFSEWFNDLEFYHYIGYLVANEKNEKTENGNLLTSLVEKWNNTSDKGSFVKFLKTQIKKRIDKCPQLDFQYKIDGSDKGKCKPILLFHNIQTVINQNYNQLKNDKYETGVFYKFPFHLYKNEGWDVEHINSNTTNPEEDFDTQKEWLLNVYLSASDATRESIKYYFETTDQSIRNDIFETIKKELLKKDNWSQEEKNRIWNYALLDSSTNRSYGNSIFSGKRRVIIGKDKGKLISIPKLTKDGRMEFTKEADAESSFVPPCTKQVFMKFFSVEAGDINYWTKEVDAPAYLQDIKDCLLKLED